jgi:uncharacterized protein (DUF427 family)
MVAFDGATIADTTRAKRVLETSHPPVHSISLEEVRTEFLARAGDSSFCEWKVRVGHDSAEVEGKRSGNAAWFYAAPTPVFAAIRDDVALCPSRAGACKVDGVRSKAGDFYGRRIIEEIVGPLAGGPGTRGR